MDQHKETQFAGPKEQDQMYRIYLSTVSNADVYRVLLNESL